ncbi:phosphoglycerate mutase [Pelomyxa schiedti]|nr:phosphoglycerate mutase [Pelomyxa schiedti]
MFHRRSGSSKSGDNSNGGGHNNGHSPTPNSRAHGASSPPPQSASAATVLMSPPRSPGDNLRGAATTFFLVRHGDKLGDDLTDIGVREADALAERMSGAQLTHVYTSPARRAQKTAKPTCDATGIEPVVLPWLMEASQLRVDQGGRNYCIWDTFGETIRGESKLPSTRDWATREPFNTPEIVEAWNNFCDDVDSMLLQHGYKREGYVYRLVPPAPEVAEVLQKHTGTCGVGHGGRIALFCHNGTLLFLLAHMLAIPLPLVFCGFFCCPSSVTTICMEQHSDEIAVPRCLGVADVSHLFKKGLEPVPRGMGDYFPQWRW